MSAVLQAREPSAKYLVAEAPTLVRQFDLLATAPGGVARLRELILTLAVQGKLVPQDQAEEPAHILLGRIGRCDIRGRRGETAELSPKVEQFGVNDQPYELPESWCWASFAQVANIASNLVSPSLHPSAWQVAPDCIEKGSGRLLQRRTVQEAGVKSANHLFKPGQILYSKIRPSLSKAIRVDFAGLCSADMYPVDAQIDPDYLLLYILSQPFLAQVTIAENRVKMPKLNQDSLNSFLVAVPPLAEQARIVTRVDELMRLCDALEANGRLEAVQHQHLLTTLLGTLTDSRTPEELAANWQLVADHFDVLLDHPEAVDALEQTILQLAVRGRLIAQDLSCNAAPTAAEDDSVEAIPHRWTRFCFGDVVSMRNGYAFKSEWFQGSGTRLVRNVNVGHGQLDWQHAAHVSQAVADEFSQFALAEGDVVLTLDRPIITTGLKLAVVRRDDLPCLLLQRVARLSPDTRVLSRDFMLLWLRSGNFVKAIDPGRSNGVPHISTKQVASLTLDLPPLEEQVRIVARVTELRSLCADLRQRLAASQTTQSHLADALVESAAA